MKPTHYLLILLSGIALNISSQNPVQYTYDDAGNRLSRTIILPSSLRSAVVVDQEPEEEAIFQETVYSDKLGQSSILIYPNPTKGILKVEITHTAEERPFTLQMYDMGGRALINEPNITSSLDMDLSSQPAGTYLLKIVSENGERTWKIIKQ